MIKSTVDFKVGKMMALENQSVEISHDNGRLFFHVKGTSGENDISLEFIAFTALEEMLAFRLNEHINFLEHVDEGDIVVGVDGVYDLNFEVKMDIVRYLPKSFLLKIDFKKRNDYVGDIEIDFSIQ